MQSSQSEGTRTRSRLAAGRHGDTESLVGCFTGGFTPVYKQRAQEGSGTSTQEGRHPGWGGLRLQRKEERNKENKASL